jgi:hypothetical protein
MSSPPHPPWFNHLHPKNTGRRIQVMLLQIIFRNKSFPGGTVSSWHCSQPQKFLSVNFIVTLHFYSLASR